MQLNHFLTKNSVKNYPSTSFSSDEYPTGVKLVKKNGVWPKNHDVQYSPYLSQERDELETNRNKNYITVLILDGT